VSADLVESVHRICVLLSDPDLMAHDLAAQLGTISKEDVLGRIDVLPANVGWRQVIVRIKTSSLNPIVNDVELVPAASLPLSSLAERFGAPSPPHRISWFSDPRVGFRFELPTGPLQIAISVDVPEGQDLVTRVRLIPSTKFKT
jgi:hypothetical protein